MDNKDLIPIFNKKNLTKWLNNLSNSSFQFLQIALNRQDY